MNSAEVPTVALERRIDRRLEARGAAGLAEALVGLKGVVLGDLYRIESLYAVGGEGAVFLTTNIKDPAAPPTVAKLPLYDLHRPFDLDEERILKRREGIRVEAEYLESNVSKYLPEPRGTYEFTNPLLDAARGGAFAAPEPAFVMEKLPGHDLDRWLARVHSAGVPRPVMRRTLDRVAVVLLQALVDLYDRGLIYADLRPGNLRMLGRPDRRIRLLDAGSLVNVDDRSGRYPHVPAYLPPEVFLKSEAGEVQYPAADAQAVMAGRTLHEVATGRMPMPGQQVDLLLLPESNVSEPVARVIEGLCRGDFPHVHGALSYLYTRAKRRVAGGNNPRDVERRAKVRDPNEDEETKRKGIAMRRPQPADSQPAVSQPKKTAKKAGKANAKKAAKSAKASPRMPAAPEQTPQASEPEPKSAPRPYVRPTRAQPAKKKRSWWRRLLGLR